MNKIKTLTRVSLLVPRAGIEPAHLAVRDFKSLVSTISPPGHRASIDCFSISQAFYFRILHILSGSSKISLWILPSSSSHNLSHADRATWLSKSSISSLVFLFSGHSGSQAIMLLWIYRLSVSTSEMLHCKSSIRLWLLGSFLSCVDSSPGVSFVRKLFASYRLRLDSRLSSSVDRSWILL